MIHLFEGDSEDPFLAVAQHVADLLNEGQNKTALAETPGSRFLDDCNNLLQEQRFDSYVSRITQHVDTILAKSSEKDAETALSIVVLAIARLPEEAATSAAKALAAALAKGDDKPEERIAALLSLYHAARSPTAQLNVLLTTLEAAKKSPRSTAMVSAAVKGKADALVHQFRLKPEQARDLYISVASLLKTAGDKASTKEYLKLMTTALNTEGSEIILKPYAAAAAAEFIKSPHMYQCDLAECPAVKQLANDSQTAPLHGLLDAMLSGSMSAFKAAATPAALQAVGMTLEAAQAKMRTMVLLSLGSQSLHQDIPLETVQQALEVNETQAELLIVKAVGQKLMDAKIDQVRGVVTVTRCPAQSFGKQQWADLKRRLAEARDAISSVTQQVAAIKPPQPVRQAAQQPVRA